MATAFDEVLTERDFRRISNVVHRHCGINLHDGKKELVRARLAKRLRTFGAATASDYLDQVMANPGGREFTELIDCLSTNLTSFFRETGHFDFLLDRFLPTLLQRKQASGNRRIRVWSAGCSTGEEPYSLAITLLHVLGERSGWDVKVLATDISTRVLRIAQAGVYDRARVGNVPPLLKGQHLLAQRNGGTIAYQVAPAARQMVTFAHLNLMAQWPFTGPFDFIFCRNVMIYFDKPTQQTLVGRFHDCLESGGLLFTGHSESLTGISHKLRYVQPTIYARA